LDSFDLGELTSELLWHAIPVIVSNDKIGAVIELLAVPLDQESLLLSLVFCPIG